MKRLVLRWDFIKENKKRRKKTRTRPRKKESFFCRFLGRVLVFFLFFLLSWSVSWSSSCFLTFLFSFINSHLCIPGETYLFNQIHSFRSNLIWIWEERQMWTKDFLNTLILFSIMSACLDFSALLIKGHPVTVLIYYTD